MDIEMFGKISDAFGPSGFEEEVVRTVVGYCGKYQVENDAMNNLYVRMPGRAGDKPVVQLDAHLDECGFMVQCIHDNGCLGILMLGGLSPDQPSRPHGHHKNKGRQENQGHHHVKARAFHE